MKKLFVLFVLLLLPLSCFCAINSSIVMSIKTTGKVTKEWAPKPIEKGDYVLNFGLRNPDGLNNKERNLSVWSKKREPILGGIGALNVSTERGVYTTPNNLYISLFDDDLDNPSWYWSYVDNRTGIGQRVDTSFDGNKIVVALSVRVFKDFTGSISIPFILPTDNWEMFDEWEIECKDIKRASGMYYTVGDKKYAITFSADNTKGYCLRKEGMTFDPDMGGELCFGDLYVEGSFPAGYENVIFIDVNFDGEPYFNRMSIYQDMEIKSNIAFGDINYSGGETYIVPETLSDLVFNKERDNEIVVNVLNTNDKKNKNTVKFDIMDEAGKTVLTKSKNITLDGFEDDFVTCPINNLGIGNYTVKATCNGQEIKRELKIIE